MVRFVWFMVILTAGVMNGQAFAQGAAVVMPMSKYVFSKDEVVDLQIHNQLDDHLLLNITPKCEVDGTILEGKECSKFFALDFAHGGNVDKIDVPKNGSIQGSVRLIGAPQRYALYKPLIAPVNNKKPLNGGVSFEFRYQPGYLFIINADKAEFGMPRLSSRSTSEEKIAVLDFDLKSLTMPSVASVSAKVIDKKSNKMIRFVRLASEKIFDPARGSITLEAGYAPPKDDAVICLDIIVQWLSTKSLQKINNCRFD